MLKDAALVVAHPDDEILWFSSILEDVARVVIGFGDIPSSPELSAGRRRAVPLLPLRNLRSLELLESEVYNSADWPDPAVTEAGVATRRQAYSMPDYSERRYVQNYHELRTQLRQELAGREWVFTHNPWGEYGHEEHVQVFRAVESLRAELKFRLLFSNYVSDKNSVLFARHAAALGQPVLTRRTNPQLGAKFKEIYRQSGCWTWYEDYAWPQEECFVEWHGPVAGVRPGTLIPFNFLRTDWEARQPRRLTLLLDGIAGLRRARAQPPAEPPP